MRRTLVSGALALAIALVSAGGAQAKLPSYIITGGDLGPYAMYFTLRDYAALNQNGVVTGADAPDKRPEHGYDIYGGWVIYDYARGERGPAYRYYPDERLLEDLEADAWFRLMPERAAELDVIIEHARWHGTNGDLERGAIAAGLRASGYAEARMWLGPEGSGSTQGVAARCPCDIPAERMESWIMQDLFETLGGATHMAPAGELPDVQVMVAFSGQEGYGWFGHYAFPQGGQPGRLWVWPNPDLPIGQPYLETTAGFDAAIADALARTDERAHAGAAPTSAASDDGRAFPWTLIGVLVAVASGLALAGAAARRRMMAHS